jgi:mRNA-degrading endonuclease RelE of RelBE toxin-antitoxin system
LRPGANGVFFLGTLGANGVYCRGGKTIHHRGRNASLHPSGQRRLGRREREAFIEFIARNPEQGDLIPETGGVRKIRWARPGSGKRGGARVIYFYHNGDRPLYLLLVYAKARQENLTAEEKKIVRKLAAILKS